MTISTKLQELGHELPNAPAPAANYVPYVVSGNQIFVAGQIPVINGQPQFLGRLGSDMSMEEGIKAAQTCALNILAQANAAVDGDWGRIKQLVKLGGFVNCTPDFTDHPTVINGASDLMVAAMGEAGKHARFAVGAPCLPLGVAVEIDAIFEIA